MIEGYIIIALKCVAVYVFIVAAIRLFGKTEFAQLSVVDLVFILLISNSVQNAMLGADNSLAGGLVGAFALFSTNYLFKRFAFSNTAVETLINGEPILLIYDGKLQEKGMSEAKLSIAQMEAAIREHGVEKIAEVNLAMFEVDGNISVLSDNYQKISKRKRKAHRMLGGNTA